jgi:transcriptional regulator with XRE-family HTH domain
MLGEEWDEERGEKDARLAIILLRSLKEWDQAELARASGIAPSQLSVYERGGRAVPRYVLERVAAAVGFPSPMLEPLLRALRAFRLAAQGETRADRMLGDLFYAELMVRIREAVAPILEELFAEEEPIMVPVAEDRDAAEELWRNCQDCTPEDWLLLVEEAEEYQSWALCERVAAASRDEENPAQALELARLAVEIADRVPGEEPWRQRVQGYALAHLSRAQRANGDPAEAEKTLACAKQLWEAGAPGDLGLLNGEGLF